MHERIEQRRLLRNGLPGAVHTGFPAVPPGRASKTVAAQYLAETLAREGQSAEFDRAAFVAKLPGYILDTIAHVSVNSASANLATEAGNRNA